MSAGLLLSHKNANTGLSISHSQYIMAPHFITIKGLTFLGYVKWSVEKGGQRAAELSFPLDRISCAPSSSATNHAQSCGGYSTGKQQDQKQIWSH